jgi:hypothetical protein
MTQWSRRFKPELSKRFLAEAHIFTGGAFFPS